MHRLTPAIATLMAATTLAGCFKEQRKDVSEYIVRAESYAAQGDAAKARVELQNALRLAPSDPKVNFALAKNEEAAGNTQAAIPYYLRAAAPDAHLREAQVRTIELLLDAGRLQDATGRINLTLGSFPNDVDTIALRADAESRQNDLVAARTDALTAVQKNPKNTRALAVLAQLDLRGQNVQAALDRLAVGLAAEPKNIRLLQVKAAALVMANRPDDALATWKTIVGIAPQDVFSQTALADLESKTGHVDRAIAGFRAAAVADRTNQDMQLSFVRFLAANGRPDDVVAYLGDLIKTSPSSSIYDLALGEYYRNSNQLEKARAVLTAARTRLGDAQAGHDIELSLAKVEAQSGRLDLARTGLGTVLKAEPANQEALFFKAELDRSGGRFQEAIDALLTVLRLDPVNGRAYEQLANLYLQQGKNKLAVDAMRRATTTPGDDAAQIRLASFLQDAGETNASQQIMQQLTSAQPGEAGIWFANGGLAIARKDWDGAARSISRLQQLPGTGALVSRLTGELQSARGDNAAALTSFETAFNAQSNVDEAALSRYVMAAANSGRSSDAAKFLAGKAASAGLPVQALLYPAIMTLRADAGEFDRALDAFDRSRALTPTDTNLYAVAARVLVAQAKFDQARQILREGIAAGAPRWALMMTMGDVDNAAGSPKLALADYKVASDENPTNVIAANNYGSVLADLEPGNTQALTEARARLNGQEASENPALIDTIAWLDYRLGRLDEAKALLTRVNAQSSPSPQRRFHLAAVLLASGDKPSGEALLGTVRGMQFPGSGEIATLSPS